MAVLQAWLVSVAGTVVMAVAIQVAEKRARRQRDSRRRPSDRSRSRSPAVAPLALVGQRSPSWRARWIASSRAETSSFW